MGREAAGGRAGLEPFWGTAIVCDVGAATLDTFGTVTVAPGVAAITAVNAAVSVEALRLEVLLLTEAALALLVLAIVVE